MLEGVFKDEPVDLICGHAGHNFVRQHVESACCEPANDAHFFKSFGAIDFELAHRANVVLSEVGRHIDLSSGEMGGLPVKLSRSLFCQASFGPLDSETIRGPFRSMPAGVILQE